jgi:hypothetical protein
MDEMMTLSVIVFLLFDYSEIDEILHPQNNRKMVLVSSPESVIQGVICVLGALSVLVTGTFLIVFDRLDVQVGSELGGHQTTAARCLD